MSKLKYVLSHALVPALVFSLLIALLTVGVCSILTRRRAVENGLCVIGLGVSMVPGSEDALKDELVKKTGLLSVDVTFLALDEAESYVKSVENYTLADYVRFACRTDHAELVLVGGDLLASLLSDDFAAPLGFAAANVPEEACRAGVPYALPLKDVSVTDYGALLTHPRQDVYALLVAGSDHEAEARAFLQQLA